MKRTASPAQADRGGIRGVVMRPWGSGVLRRWMAGAGFVCGEAADGFIPGLKKF